MHRHSFEHDGLLFSFLDVEGDGAPLVALHGHWMAGSDFTTLATGLAPAWRLIALDQRGFGETDHDVPHSLPAYVGDVVALLDHLGLHAPVPVLGHSFGGVVACHLAAAHPDRVSAMIIEDIGVVLDDDSSPFVAAWGGTFRRREALEERLGPRLAPYLQRSIRRAADGWSLNFTPEEFLRSEQAINGDHRAVWQRSTCPALVISGRDSVVSDAAALRRMADDRDNTTFARLDAGHSVHIDAPADFALLVDGFLRDHASA